MNFNEEEFLKTELGTEMKKCIDLLDLCLRIEDYNRAKLCQAQWEVYHLNDENTVLQHMDHSELLCFLSS